MLHHLPDGRTLAIKISDGNARAMSAITAAALAKFGIDAGESRLIPLVQAYQLALIRASF
jgi:L-asparaginase II